MRRAIRLSLLALLAPVACTSPGGCGCVTPPAAPLPETERVYDGVQAFVSPEGFDFLGSQVDDFVASLLASGLGFEIPEGVIQQGCIGASCLVDATYCSSNPGCPVDVTLRDVHLVRRAPATLRMEGLVDAAGLVDLVGQPTCDIDIAVVGKPVSLDVVLGVDAITHALTLTPGSLDFTLEQQDFVVRGGLDCAAVGLFLGAALPELNSQLAAQIDESLEGILDPTMCMPCDSYTEQGCYDGTACAGDPLYCRPRGAMGEPCTTRYQGLEGEAAVASLLGGTASPEAPALRLLLALGQKNPTTFQRPIEFDDAGLKLNLISGAAATGTSACVPACTAPGCVPPPVASPNAVDFGFEASRLDIPGYMLGLGASETFLDKAAFEAWRTGAFCLTIDSSTASVLHTGTFSALMGSLDSLASDGPAPMRIVIRPTRPPDVAVGRGTFTTDPATGERTVDEPLLLVGLPDLSLDFYALVQERWLRLFTLVADVEIPVSLDAQGGNRLVPVIGDLASGVRNVRAANAEILAEDPAQLAALLPTLLDLAAPSLTAGLTAVELPELQGFRPVVRAISGIVERPQGGSFEQLGIFADLEATGAPFPSTADTGATLRGLHFARGPERRLVDGRLPEAYAVVEAGSPTAGAEVQYRIDAGLWSPWQPAGELRIARPVLQLPGRHRLELRARAAGDGRTVDPTPAVLEALVDFTPPRLSVERGPDGAATALQASDDLSAAGALRFRFLSAGSWTEAAPTAPELASAEQVEVRDEAGNTASVALSPALLRGAATAAAGSGNERGSEAVVDGSTGCSAGGTGGELLLAAGAVLALLSRRRGAASRSPRASRSPPASPR